MEDADAWWGRHERGLGSVPHASPQDPAKNTASYERTLISNRPVDE